MAQVDKRLLNSYSGNFVNSKISFTKIVKILKNLNLKENNYKKIFDYRFNKNIKKTKTDKIINKMIVEFLKK